VIGIAGGPAAGKSTVARLLAELGAAVVDADRLGHEVLKEDWARDAARRRWGDAVLDEKGEVDRRKLGRIVFRSEEDRRFLNELVHPRIRALMQEEIERHRAEGAAKWIVLDAALLLEGGLEAWCDVLVFVEAAKGSREARAGRERGWEPGEMARREAAQMPLEEKRGRCGFVVYNDGTIEATRKQVRELCERLEGNGSCGR